MERLLLLLLLTFLKPLLFCRGVNAGLCSSVISPAGFNCIEHQATTDDGFILGIQNIPSSTGVPVFLMHGLLGGGDNWVSNPPSEALGFILANAGYDVWIGNNRCIQWSGGHTTFSPYSNGFWAWTYDELSTYDLKTMTEFVYNQRGKFFYVGHSQGTLMLLAGLTGGPFTSQVLGYLQGAVLLAPVAFVGHVTPTLLKAGLEIYADTILPAIGIQDFDANLFTNLACTNLSLSTSFCDNLYTDILELTTGEDNYLDLSRFPIYNKYFPQSTSSHNINHYGQSFRGNNFQLYDKGLVGNLASYGQDSPPSYDLSAFPSSLPLQLWYGGVDGLADPTDVSSLLGQLPSSNREDHLLSNYGHLDFIVGTQASTDIYGPLMDFIQAHAEAS